MIRWFSLTLLLLVGCAQLPQQNNLSNVQRIPLAGVLSEDTVLDGDYLLVADLQVPVGVTLTIQSGSTILVVPSDSTKIGPEYLSKETEILIRGRLLVQGTSEAPIRIYPEGDDRESVLWAGIEFVASNGSRLEYLQVEQADVAILCLNASPTLSFSQLQRNRYGILLHENSCPQLSDNVLQAGESGLFCWDQSAPFVERNSFLEHREEGIYLGRGCRAKLQGNLIEQNDRGIVLPHGVEVDSTNLISGNRLDIKTYPAEALP